MKNCQEIQQEIKHAKLFWSTKRKKKTNQTKNGRRSKDKPLKGLTASSRSSTSETAWRAKTADPSSGEGSSTSYILWWQRQLRGCCLPFCFQDAILDISSSPMAAVGPSLCWVKHLWSQAPGQICKMIWLIKQRERGWKSVLMLMLWFAGTVNPALKLLLPNPKNVIKNQDMVKISSGGLSLLHSLLPIRLCIGRLLAKSTVGVCLPQAT